jgi:hypothetical protein
VEPIETVEEMLNSEINFGFIPEYNLLFPDTSDPLDSALVNGAVECPNEFTCFTWAAIYRNISTILNDLHMEDYRGKENWIDKNNRLLLCELKMVLLEKSTFLFWLKREATFLNL